MRTRIYARICVAMVICHLASFLPTFADPSATSELKEFKLDENLSVKLPGSFQLQKIADNPLSYLAVGPSPDGSGKKRPAVFFFLSTPVGHQGRNAFLAAAKRAAANTMNRFGIRVTDSADIEAKDGIEGTNMTAENAQGKSWWAVRTLHRKNHSLQVIIGAFEKDTFDRLAKQVSDGSIFAN
jgi:hypothetical protein